MREKIERIDDEIRGAILRARVRALGWVVGAASGRIARLGFDSESYLVR